MRAYLYALLGALGLALGAVLTLNLLLGARALGSTEATLEASRWQQHTRGVTYAPPISAARPFKALLEQDELDRHSKEVAALAMFGRRRIFNPGSWTTPNAA